MPCFIFRSGGSGGRGGSGGSGGGHWLNVSTRTEMKGKETLKLIIINCNDNEEDERLFSDAAVPFMDEPMTPKRRNYLSVHSTNHLLRSSFHFSRLSSSSSSLYFPSCSSCCVCVCVFFWDLMEIGRVQVRVLLPRQQDNGVWKY